MATPTATPTTATSPKNLRRVYAWAIIGVAALRDTVVAPIGTALKPSELDVVYYSGFLASHLSW